MTRLRFAAVAYSAAGIAGLSSYLAATRGGMDIFLERWFVALSAALGLVSFILGGIAIGYTLMRAGVADDEEQREADRLTAMRAKQAAITADPKRVS